MREEISQASCTPSQAKAAVAGAIKAAGLPPHKLSVKTVGFRDLARCCRVVVTVHGWRPSTLVQKLRDAAKSAGCLVQFD